jgi:hypothetical protein
MAHIQKGHTIRLKKNGTQLYPNAISISSIFRVLLKNAYEVSYLLMDLVMSPICFYLCTQRATGKVEIITQTQAYKTEKGFIFDPEPMCRD